MILVAFGIVGLDSHLASRPALVFGATGIREFVCCSSMTSVERKEHIATWNGDATLWLDYVKRVRLQYERTEPKKRCLLGAELASRLTGKA